MDTSPQQKAGEKCGLARFLADQETRARVEIEKMRFKVGLVVLLMAIFLQPAPAQEERIQKLFQDAIEAMGGDTFLAVKDMVSEGHFFMFDRRGGHTNRIKFFDWTKLPDKVRYEVGNKKKEREVTVFNLESDEGWIMEGRKTPRDATPEEMKRFRASAKHSIDIILRFRYQDQTNKLFYLGTGDGPDVKYELVKLLDPENDEVTIYFDRMSKLPARIRYRIVDKDGVQHRIEDEFSQWHKIQGVRTPLRLDSTYDGRQSQQTFVFSVTYNNALLDSFFSKPVPPK